MKKFKSIADSEFEKFWDYEKNSQDPTTIGYKSNKKYWWICEKCGSCYERSASHIHETHLCRKCALKKRVDNNRLARLAKSHSIADDPVLSKLWDYETNKEDPKTLTYRNNNYFNWICPQCGKSYRRNSCYQYVSSHLCYDCAEVVKHNNQTASMVKKAEKVSERPSLLAQWNYEKNKVNPSEVAAHSTMLYWWRCPMCGKLEHNSPDHKYYAKVCWECGNKVQGIERRKSEVRRKGSFEDKFPHLAKDWHPTLNGNITPYDVTSGNSEYFYFKCQYGHTYRTTVTERVSRHAGCPICSTWLRTSFAEQTISFYLSQVISVMPNHKIDDIEFDVYLPELSSAIEYDGMFWHSFDNKVRMDSHKDEYSLSHGIRLIRVKEAEHNEDRGDIIYAKRRNTDFKWLISLLIEKLGIRTSVDVDIERDTPTILSRVKPTKKENSIAEKRKDLLPYWDKDANYPINPEMIAVRSHFKFSWKCPQCGHEWKDAPITVTQRKGICPKCREKEMLSKGKDAYGRFLKSKDKIYR